MNAENIIRDHDSGRRPFATPDGYFDSFTARLMSRLPEQPQEQTPPRIVALNPMRRLMRYAATVAIAVLCLGGGLYLYNGSHAPATVTASADEMLDGDNLEEILDYEMLSNNQIAYYLTEAY